MTEAEWLDKSRWVVDQTAYVPVTGYLGEHSLTEEFDGSVNDSGTCRLETLDARVVVVVGEVGAGKSNEIARWCRLRSEQGIRASLWSLRTEDVVNLHVRWKQRPEVARWLEDGGTFELFLDGVDEISGEIDEFVTNLRKFLESLDRHQLKLRITSRPAGYTPMLASTLAELFGERDISVVNLLPLTREDVGRAARHHRLGSEEFLQSVEARGAESLASRPLTLKMLLASKGEFPLSRAELFERHLLRIFRGTNEGERGPHPTMSASQRMSLASAVAAMTLFSDRPFIIPPGAVEPDGLGSALMLEGVSGRLGGRSEQVVASVENFQELFRIGVFGSTGVGGPRVWESRAYEEFLAARLLASYEPSEKLVHRIFVDIRQGDRVVPALRGALGWLADLSPASWKSILDTSPRALLEADLAVRGPEDKSLLLKTWLSAIDRGDISDDSFERGRKLASFEHPALHEVLSPWLTTTRRNVHAVRAAIMVAAETGCVRCVGLLHELVETEVLDRDPARVMARFALRALNRFHEVGLLSDLETKGLYALSRRILSYGVDLDPNDNLLGLAFRLLRRAGQLSTKELLRYLRPPHDQDHFGSYQTFLLFELPVELAVQDLPKVLDSFCLNLKKADSSRQSFYLGDTIVRLITRAREHFSEPAVRGAVARALLSPSLHFRLEEADSEALRSVLFVETLIAEADESNFSYQLNHVLSHGLSSEKLWRAAFSIFGAGGDHAVRAGRALSVWFSWDSREQIEQVLEVGDKTGLELHSLVSQRGSTAEQVSESIAAERIELQASRGRETVLDPPLNERVLASLEGAQSGAGEKFWALVHNLYRRPEDRAYRARWKQPLTDSYGYGFLDEVQRKQVELAARRFLEMNDSNEREWLGQAGGSVAYPYMGCAAFVLLLDQGSLTSLSTDTLHSWASALVYLDSEIDNLRFHSILDLLRESVPAALGRAWASQLQGQGGHLSLRAFGEHGWCPEVEKAMIAVLKQEDVSERALGAVLTELLKKEVPEAHEWAAEKLGSLTEGGADIFGTEVALALLRSGTRNVSTVLDWLELEATDTKSVLETLGNRILWHQTISRAWAVESVARFAAILAICFPPDEDPQYVGGRVVGADETMRTERDRSLEVLVELADDHGEAAVRGLRGIEERFPSWHLVSHHRRVAEERAAVASWNPLEPLELLTLICN